MCSPVVCLCKPIISIGCGQINLECGHSVELVSEDIEYIIKSPNPLEKRIMRDAGPWQPPWMYR